MSFFRNINLPWKFSIFGGLVSLLLFILLAISYSGLTGTEARFKEYSERSQEVEQRLFNITAQGLQSEQAIRNIILNPGDEKASGKKRAELYGFTQKNFTTTRATKEIGEMIRAIQNETRQAMVAMEDGVKGTEKGAAEAASMEAALMKILEQVNAVTMQISQIATTSEITSNIYKISDVIDGTSKGAQDTSSAAASFARSGEELRHLMSLQANLGSVCETLLT